MEKVILVNEKDEQVGTEEKMKAHSNGGILHRAFSIFVFNSRGELMLQRRALTKYHSKGLWTNTVCSHPREGESILDASHRRLMEEMGFDCPLAEKFSFTYHENAGSELTEWEYDHVLFGAYEAEPKPNHEEVDAWKWVTLDELKKDVAEHPERYTAWLKIVLDRVIEERENNNGK
jgi:isopentenyl-diphosphate delta-isomerase